MDNKQKETINLLKSEGKGYRVIASEVGLPMNSVKSWCRRHPYDPKQKGLCLNCGIEIVCTPHKRQRKFCSDICSLDWWTAHPEKRLSKSSYTHTCRLCGKMFANNRIIASYCNRTCFAGARSKAGSDE